MHEGCVRDVLGVHKRCIDWGAYGTSGGVLGVLSGVLGVQCECMYRGACGRAVRNELLALGHLQRAQPDVHRLNRRVLAT